MKLYVESYFPSHLLNVTDYFNFLIVFNKVYSQNRSEQNLSLFQSCCYQSGQLLLDASPDTGHFYFHNPYFDGKMMKKYR